MRFLGLGLPEWLTIIGLVGGLIVTFRVMAKASVRYEAARKAREQRQGLELEQEENGERTGSAGRQNSMKEEEHEDRHPS